MSRRRRGNISHLSPLTTQLGGSYFSYALIFFFSDENIYDELYEKVDATQSLETSSRRPVIVSRLICREDYYQDIHIVCAHIAHIYTQTEFKHTSDQMNTDHYTRARAHTHTHTHIQTLYKHTHFYVFCGLRKNLKIFNEKMDAIQSLETPKGYSSDCIASTLYLSAYTYTTHKFIIVEIIIKRKNLS